MAYARPRNHGCRISDAWTYAGMRTLILENELLRVTLLLDKGSDIVEFRYKPLDLDVLLSMPGGLRNPMQGLPSTPSANPFMNNYAGGWNEVLPNGGPETAYKGAGYGQHGEISLIPWEHAILEDSPFAVAVRLWVRPIRTPFLVEKVLRLRPGRAVMEIEEQVTNEAGEPLHLMWGQHIAFGRPFLDEGAVIDVPACRLMAHEAMPGYEPRRFEPGASGTWPRIPASGGGIADASEVPAYGPAQAQEMAYLAELSEGWYAITNPLRAVGFGISFDPALFRFIWYWQQLGDVAKGYPWWGRLHTTALEPWTSYPTGGLAEAIANGSALLLAPGRQIRTRLCAVVYEGSERVARITPEGEAERQQGPRP